jgi:hypothetical protein
MVRVTILVLVAVLTLTDLASAQRGRANAQRVDPLTSSIRGRVTTADTGSPISGAEVRLAMDGRFSRLVTTNGEGRYEFKNLPAGEYALNVSRTGFISLESGQRQAFEPTTTIVLREGQSATSNVALIRGGAIYGRLVDEFSDPSVGTRVQVFRVRIIEGRRRLFNIGGGDLTDDTGAFRLHGLAPADYYVAASTGNVDAVKRDPPIYYPGTANFAEAQPITLSVGSEASADFQIASTQQTTTVSGVVLNSAGAPVPAMINLVSEAVGFAANGQSPLMLHDDAAPDGTFSIGNVPPGPYNLTAMLMMRSGPDAPPISGTFGLPTAAAREDMMRQVPETASMPIVVSGNEMSGLTIVTRRPGRLNGRFIADTGVTRALPTGMRVSLRSLGGNNITMTMGNGTPNEFQLVGAGGPNRVDVQQVPDGWAVKSVLLNGDDVTDDAFELTAATGDLRVVMTDRLTTVSGTIQSRSATRNHTVLVFSDEDSKWKAPTRFVRAARPGDDGSFQMRGLPGGQRYLAVAIDYFEDGEEQDVQLLERLRARATAFTLAEGEHRSIQLDAIAR